MASNDTKASNSTSLFQLELIRQRDPSELDTTILNAFTRGMEPATDEAAAEAASQLDESCPPLERVKEVRNYLRRVWDVMLDIARSPDVTSQIHKRLISILESLRQIAKGDLIVYSVSTGCFDPVRWLYSFFFLIDANDRKISAFGQIYLCFQRPWKAGSMVNIYHLDTLEG
jgi:hypothetical protein